MSTYSLMEELMASGTMPISSEKRLYHMAIMRRAMNSLMHAPTPIMQDWQALATAFNMMTTLIEMGELQDPDGLRKDVLNSMVATYLRHTEKGQTLRLDGPGITSMQHFLDDYEEVLKELPHRTVIRAYRLTEKKVVTKFGKNSKKRVFISRI